MKFCESTECDGNVARWWIVYGDEQRFACRNHVESLLIDGCTVMSMDDDDYYDIGFLSGSAAAIRARNGSDA